MPYGLPINKATNTRFYVRFEWTGDDAHRETPELECLLRVGPALNCSGLCTSLASSMPPPTPDYIQLNEIVLIDHPPSTYNCAIGCEPCPGSAKDFRYVQNCIVCDGHRAYKRFAGSKCECKERIDSAKQVIEVLDLYFPPQQR